MTEIRACKKANIYKIVLTVILLAGLLFVFIQRDCLQDEKEIKLFESSAETVNEGISIKGSHEVRQPFTAEYGTIENIKIRFQNEERLAATGTVTLILEDDAGNEIASTEMGASYLQSGKNTKFVLGGDSESANSNRIVSTNNMTSTRALTKVKKGQEYVLIIRTEGIDAPGSVELLLKNDTAIADSSRVQGITIDNEARETSCLSATLFYMNYAGKTIRLLLVLLVLTILFIWLPFDKHEAISKWLLRGMFILTPFVAYFVIQKFAEMKLSEFLDQMNSVKGLLNLIAIITVWWLIYTITNRTKWTAIGTVLMAGLFGFINYIMLIFRDSPLIATDIAQWKTGLEVVNSYVITYDKAFLTAFTLMLLWCVATASLKGYPGLKGKKRLIPICVMALVGGVFYYTFFQSDIIEKNNINVSGFKPKGSYKRNGSTLSFMVTVRNSFVERPDDYSVSAVEAIADKYESDHTVIAAHATKESPNIIVIMNESFSDLSVLGDVKTNEDWMPFYHSLEEDTIKGWMHSSVYGGSTADSEFEFLTGFSMRYLPFHSVPYRSVIRDAVPTFTTCLRQEGYAGNIAFHPGMRDSYNRDNVYPLLGFDKHIALEDLKDAENIRDYVSDACDYDVVINEYEKCRKNSDEPFYMFNVTIQNHGGYLLSTGVVDAGIVMTDSEQQEESAGQFLNLMKKSDEALEELIHYFREQEEPTVVVMFGDHQPRLGGSFYDSFDKEQQDLDEITKADLKYKVPFMIWANYDIEEEQGVEISANYLAAYLKDSLEMPMTGFDKYLMSLREQLPVITAICYEDSNGRVYDPAESTDYDSLLNEYGIIQYNGLIDHNHTESSFFELANN